MKRIFVGVLLSIPFIAVLPMIYAESIIYQDYYRYMKTAFLLANMIICIIFATRSKERDERIFFILISASMFFYFVDGIFDIISIYSSYPIDIYDAISDFVGNLPILALLIYRIIVDFKHIKKENRTTLLFGSIVSSSGFVLLGVIVLRVALSTPDISMNDILLYLPFLIVNILMMVLLVTLYILYVEVNFRYYILALLSGYFFLFVGDVFEFMYALYKGVV
ncbi:MAG: hypothetical protein KAS52_07865, partial [Candidatus Heimdallarchaeota archaeon]|nr:hypothetical protein [Candidatus Heimdallarchaeota archaeon]